MKKTLAVIDGHSLMHRAFHALPPMSTRAGEPTNAVYGFINMLLRLVDTVKPTHLAEAFVRKEPTFRHQMYEAYKATRAPMDDELRPQFPRLKEVLGAMGIAMCEMAGYEADDILGTLSRAAEDYQVMLVTGDKDALQLIDAHTSVLLTKRGISETALMDEAALMAEYGMTGEKMIEVKALMGDNSDNIPGVPGVGEKTALKLIAQYGTLENLYAHIEEIAGKLKERLASNEALAYTSRELARICTDAPVTTPISEMAFERAGMEGGVALLRALEMRTLAERVERRREEDIAPAARTDIQTAAETVIVTDAQALRVMADAARASSVIALTGGERITLCTDSGVCYHIPLGATLLDPGLPLEAVWGALKDTLEAAAPLKTLWDAKSWMHRLLEYGVKLSGVSDDVMLKAYLVDTARFSDDMNAWIKTRLGEEAVCDAGSLLALSAVLHKEMDEKQLLKLYDEVEMPLLQVLYDMEREGFSLDEQVLRTLQEQYAVLMRDIESEIYALAGETFSILSPKQLGAVLFEKLGLKASKKTKSGYSTDASVLEELQDEHPVVPKVLEYRHVAKLKSTYLDALLLAMDESKRVHTRFAQAHTATGRISSINPNLQNIPVRTSLGREIRRAFVPREGWVLIDGDYSQIELRVLAHIAGDERMIAAFHGGGDIHRETAAAVFGGKDVSAEMRSAAKAVNFGIVYGISDFGLARQLGISRKLAAEHIESYLGAYSGIRQYMRDIVEQGKRCGYVSTLLGRRRELYELKSANHNLRAFGERIAMNMPIQGTAADIIKLAMIRVSAALKEKKLRARLLLQVHDELLIEAPPEEAEAVSGLLKDCMERVIALKVPLIADVHTGLSWYETK